MQYNITLWKLTIQNSEWHHNVQHNITKPKHNMTQNDITESIWHNSKDDSAQYNIRKPSTTTQNPTMSQNPIWHYTTQHNISEPSMMSQNPTWPHRTQHDITEPNMTSQIPTWHQRTQHDITQHPTWHHRTQHEITEPNIKPWLNNTCGKLCYVAHCKSLLRGTIDSATTIY